MKTLFAYKNELGTILINSKKEIVSFYPMNLKQPHRNRRNIIHNCFNYKLEWIKLESKKEIHWYNQTVMAVKKKAYKTFFIIENPFDYETKKSMIEDSKNTPLTIEFINPFQFSVKIDTKF